MRVHDEDTWEADYWDDFRAEFGNEAYVQARYICAIHHQDTFSQSHADTPDIPRVTDQERSEAIRTATTLELGYNSDDLDRIAAMFDRGRSKSPIRGTDMDERIV